LNRVKRTICLKFNNQPPACIDKTGGWSFIDHSSSRAVNRAYVLLLWSYKMLLMVLHLYG